MIKVKLGEKEIDVIPQLTISRWQKIQRNLQRYEDTSELLALYLDIEVKELRELPVEQIKFVEDILTQHLMKPRTNEIALTFNYKGTTYGLENDWQNMTWGQWVDIEVFSQKDKIMDNIHIIMSLLYRPVIIQDGTTYKLEPFDSDKVMERAEKFLNLPIWYWFGAATFFLSMSSEYIKDIETSLKAQMKIEKLLKPVMKILPKWLQRKLQPDFTLSSVSRLREMI